MLSTLLCIASFLLWYGYGVYREVHRAIHLHDLNGDDVIAAFVVGILGPFSTCRVLRRLRRTIHFYKRH